MLAGNGEAVALDLLRFLQLYIFYLEKQVAEELSGAIFPHHFPKLLRT